MMMKRLALLFAVLPSLAWAQSSPNWPQGYRPTVAEWNAAFAAKLDLGGGSGLPITGGTVTGPSTFSGAGTGLTITNNEAIGGNLTIGGTLSSTGTVTLSGAGTGLSVVNNAVVAGTLSVGGALNIAALNVTSSAGIQFNGATGLFITAGIANQQGVFLGPQAGAFVRNNNLPTNFGMLAAGAHSLENLTNTTAEASCGGPFSCWQETSGYGITGFGQSTISFDSASYVSAFGNDAMRDTVGNGGSSAFGAQSQRDGVGNSNTSIGAFSLQGNAGSIKVTGSVTTGDVLHLAFATTSVNTTGLPATVSYTVQPGDTLATIAIGLQNAIINQLNVGYVLIGGQNILTVAGVTNWLTAFTIPIAGSPAVVALHFNGGNTTGMAVTVTPSCTGVCTETMAYSAAFSGTHNIAEGYYALAAASLTGGNFNHARGSYALGMLSGSPSGVQADGYEAGYFALSGGNSVIAGLQAAYNATVLTGDVIINPGGFGSTLTTGVGETVISGFGNTCGITTGSYNMCIGYASSVPSGTASFQGSIMNAIYITGANPQASAFGQVGIGGDSSGGAILGVLGPDTSTTLAFRVQNSTPALLMSISDAGVLKLGAPMTTANGSVAVTLTSLGPAGSHTTVQEWLTFTDSAGTVRYVPAY